MIEKNVKVSIVIPNYNGILYMENCIRSLKNQTFDEFEILVIDNDSKDGSLRHIECNYPDIKLKKLDRNYGFAKAVNEGILMSQGEFVVLLNNDTEVDERWLEFLVAEIQKEKSIFSVSSKMIQYNQRNLIDDAGDEYTILGWTLKNGDGSRVEAYNKTKEVFASCAGSAIYRKKIFEEIGYFDENFFAYMEDVDISYRARLHGYKNIYCSKALVYHIGSGTTGSRYNDFKIKLSARNNILMPYKNMPNYQLLFNLPFLLLGFIIKYIFFAVKGYGKSYKVGIVDGLKHLKTTKKINFEEISIIKILEIECVLFKNIFVYLYEKMKKCI